MMKAAKESLALVAAQLGFSALGVADAAAAQGDLLPNWLAQGKNADMAWMQRHLAARLDPELVLAGVKRVVMLSFEYAKSDARALAGQKGRIARYAQGRDYHQILAPKLADLDELLQNYGGQQRCFADSGPVSERFFAQQAGLGWIGRHGQIIRQGQGSYRVLASILTTLELPLDEPAKNHCGFCRRCVEACPVGALDGSSCDARRCLSYWTIEAPQETPLPDDVVRAIREHGILYGCDLCQEACPHNARTRGSAARTVQRVDPLFLMPAELAHCSAGELAALSETEFEQFFAGSPMRRAGYAKWQRIWAILRPE